MIQFKTVMTVLLEVHSTPAPPVTYLIESTHPGDGADVVGDGDQRCPCQVRFGHRLPLLFGHHVAKTVKSKWETFWMSSQLRDQTVNEKGFVQNASNSNQGSLFSPRKRSEFSTVL